LKGNKLSYDSNQKRIELLNIACHTPKINNLTIERKNGATLSLRPTIHQFYSIPFGGLKSTLMKLVEKCYSGSQPIRYCADATSAGIQGSIDQKSREYVPPIAYLCKQGTLLIDEFNLNPNVAADVVRSLLSLLEDEIVARKMGIVGKKSIEKKDIFCKHGWLIYRDLRTNVIFGTMKNILKNRKTFYNALVSRCVPIRIEPSIEVLETFDDNPKALFQYIGYKIHTEINVSNREYIKIRNFVKKYDVSPQLFFRTLNDCVRIYAIVGKHDYDLYDFVIKSRNIHFCTIED
jgi:hypothetical protein